MELSIRLVAYRIAHPDPRGCVELSLRPLHLFICVDLSLRPIHLCIRVELPLCALPVIAAYPLLYLAYSGWAVVLTPPNPVACLELSLPLPAHSSLY